MKEPNKIYIDNDGNVDVGTYWKEIDIPILKKALETKGHKNIEIIKDEDSLKEHKPWAPKLSLKISRERTIDWTNPKVIVSMIMSEKNYDLMKDEVILLSGKDPKKSKTSGMATQIRHGPIIKAYQKWKIENKITETIENRQTLAEQFAPIYIKSQKRGLKIGDKVFIPDDNENGIIKNYDEKLGYLVTRDSGEGYLQRREIRLIP